MKKFFAVFFATLSIWLTSAAPTKADPITAAIVAFTGWVAAQGAVAIAIFNAVNIALMQAAVSMLAKALRKKPVPPGIKLERTLTGGAVSRRGIIGWYATAGSEVCPPMSHGNDGKTPNAYLTKVIALSDIPVHQLTGVMIGGEFVPFSNQNNEYGNGLAGKYNGLAWIKFYDGRQTGADPMLVSRYSSYMRPWNFQRYGTGVAYAIFTFKLNTDVFKGEPDVRVELIGARMYDVRKDSTVGGSGGHRWGQPLTYEPTFNPIVMTYNILRGFDLGGGSRWGGECEASDLPVSNWAAAMNVCDEAVALDGGGSETRYRAGYEIDFVEDEPASVIEELLKACSGSIVELGGVYKVRCGPPSLPVMFVTDEDFIVTKEQDFDPFPEINASHNSIHCVFPHPLESWNTHDAPPYRVPEYVTQDDGIERPASIQLPACPFPLQVQRNMRAWLQDDRRWRQHSATFGPYAWALEPLDCIAWSSKRNGYVNKLFEVDTADEHLMNLSKRVQLREVDPSDYDWQPSFELPDPVTPGTWVQPQIQAVPGWAVQPWIIVDSDGDDRRPALRVSWDTEGAEDATALKIQVRIAGTDTLVVDETAALLGEGDFDPDAGFIVAYKILSAGILPATSYEARAQYVVERPTDWSSWIGATTEDVRLGEKDVDIDKIVEEVVKDLEDKIDGLEELIDGFEKEAEDDIDVILNEHAEREVEYRRRVEDVRTEQRNRQENIAEVNNQISIVKTENEASVQSLTTLIAATNEAVALVEIDAKAYTDNLRAYSELNFTTIAAFDDGLAATLNSSKSYTDALRSEASTTYTTQTSFASGMAATLNSSKSYTDALRSEAATTYATNVALNNGLAATLTSAQSFTTGSISTAMNTVYTKAQTDAGLSSTLTASRSYTDTLRSDAVSTYSTKVERENGDAATLQSANATLDDYKSTATQTFATIANLGTVSSTATLALTSAVDAKTQLGEAAFEVVAGSGGDPAVIYAKAKGSTSVSGIAATVISFANFVGGTAIKAMQLVAGEVFFMRPFYIDVGSKRLIVGPGNEWVLWFGPNTINAAGATRTNGHWAFGSDGRVYYGNEELLSGGGFFAQANLATYVGSRTTAGLVTTSLATITTSGATGAVSYSWAQTGGNEEWTIVTPGGASTTFRVNVSTPGEIKRAAFVCRVTDAGSGRSFNITVGGAAIYNV